MKFGKGIIGTVLLLIVTTIQPTSAENENPILRGKQRQLPNDIEQKASYCLAVIKLQHSAFVNTIRPENNSTTDADIDSITDPDIRKDIRKSFDEAKKIENKAIEEMKDQINRLQHFLLPRTPYLVPNIMLAAYSRGEKDYYNQQKSQKSKQCMDRCKNNKDNKWESCFMPCMEEDDLNRRIFQCRDLSFLPY